MVQELYDTKWCERVISGQFGGAWVLVEREFRNAQDGILNIYVVKYNINQVCLHTSGCLNLGDSQLL